MKRFAELLHDRHGAAAVEFALVAPLLLTMVVGTVERARRAWGTAATRDVTARAARCIAVTPLRCGTRAQISTAMAADAPMIAGAVRLPDKRLPAEFESRRSAAFQRY